MLEIIIDSLSHIRDTFNHHILFSLAALLLTGYILGKLAERVKLPNITGFIIAGFLLSESCTEIVHSQMAHYMTNVTEVALGIIALTIGCEFSVSKLKKLGLKIIIITLTQLILTFIIVFTGLKLIGIELHIALLLGAIATATAPAATVAIVQSMRVRGEFVDYLYGIVALDDAGCIILFSVVFALTAMLVGGENAISIKGIITHGFFEIGASLLLGFIGGIILHFATVRVRFKNELLIVATGIVFLITAIAVSLHISPLLSNMMVGATLINISWRNERILRALQPITPPLYATFFAAAGTELNLSMIGGGMTLLMGGVYILLRAIGKYSGIFIGSTIIKAPVKIRNYLGLCMLPQAGVAIGLVLFIETTPILTSGTSDISSSMSLITAIALFSVFINELLGPPLSKLGLHKGMLE